MQWKQAGIDGTRLRRKQSLGYLRMLVDELGGIVDLIVNDDEQVLLGVVLSNILIGELLLRGHFCEYRY